MIDWNHIQKHIAKSWKHHVQLQLATIFVLLASFSVITGVLTLNQNLKNLLTLWGESLQVSVYLSENANAEAIHGLEQYLKENEKVDKLKFVSKEDALVQFREQMASYAPDLLGDGDLLKFIPASFQFSISKKVSSLNQPTVMKEMAEEIKKQTAVDDVSYGQDWIKSYSALTSSLTLIGQIFVIVVFISAAFVMSNSIHNSISQRRTEVEVLELIGATQKYVRTPYLWEGAILGGVSCLLALALCFGLFSSIKNYFHAEISFMQLLNQVKFLSPMAILSLFVFSVAAGAFSSYLCVQKINNGWAASQKSQR